MTSSTRPRIILVRDALSQWQVEARLQGSLDIPLSLEGMQETSRIAQKLEGLGKAHLYSGRGQTSRETAEAVSERLGVKVRSLDDLEEVNLGIWQGLLLSDIKSKYRRAYRAWRDDPTVMTPPSGEDIRQAARRAARAINDIVKKLDEDDVAVFILPPLLKAAAACRLTNRPASEIVERYEQNELISRLSDPEELEQPGTPEVPAASTTSGPRRSESSTSARRNGPDPGRVADV
ncbi:MAG: histidine phosphatase family protein [Planctomycetota bacterium]